MPQYSIYKLGLNVVRIIIQTYIYQNNFVNKNSFSLWHSIKNNNIFF